MFLLFLTITVAIGVLAHLRCREGVWLVRFLRPVTAAGEALNDLGGLPGGVLVEIVIFFCLWI